MAVDPIGSTSESGATVVTSAALALSQQARQGVAEQVEKIVQQSKESDKDEQRLKPVEDGQETAKSENQPQNQAGETSQEQTVPARGQTVNIVVE